MTTETQLYQIRIEGQLDRRWNEWFDGMKMTYEFVEIPQTVLTGYVLDQPALHGMLNKIRDLNLPLIAVVRLPFLYKTQLAAMREFALQY